MVTNVLTNIHIILPQSKKNIKSQDMVTNRLCDEMEFGSSITANVAKNAVKNENFLLFDLTLILTNENMICL